MEETPVLQRNGSEVQRKKDDDVREADETDGPGPEVTPKPQRGPGPEVTPKPQRGPGPEVTPKPQRGPTDKRFYTLGHQRRSKHKALTDFTTVSKGTSAGVKPRTALRQVLFNQAEKNSAPEERGGQLDLLKQALEVFAVPVDLTWKWREEVSGSTLETHWKDLVDSHATMSKLQRHQQEALWELLHTELSYINRIIIIVDLVLAALVYLHQRGFLLQVKPEALFSNLPSILGAHQLFWQEVLFPMLQEVRSSRRPFDPLTLEAGCLQFHERFSSYHEYCWQEEENLEFARRQMETNLHFVTYVQWVETHPQCFRMRLGDMQAKPHQRITKYPLLLKAALKTSAEPHVQQRLRGMLSSVNSFLESINDFLRQKDEEQALQESALRLEAYEMEGLNEEVDQHVRDICHFQLTCPVRGVGSDVVRKLLLEENLKLRGRKDSKLEVVVLLFSDVLLVTKAQKKGEKLKVVRPPLALDRTCCRALRDTLSFVLVEVGELQCAMNVYIFTAGTSERCCTWVSTVKKAKENLRVLRELETRRRGPDWRVPEQENQPQVHGDQEPSSATAASESVDDTNFSDASFWTSQQEVTSARPQAPGYEWIEMGVRGQEPGGNHTDEEETIFPSRDSKTHRYRRAQSIPTASRTTSRLHRAGRHSLIPGGYPDVDYPTESDQTNGLESSTTTTSPSSSPTIRSSTSEAPAVWTSNHLRSPRLRRRRPLPPHHGPLHQTRKPELRSSCSSNSDSDSNLKKTTSSDARKVLKLGSLKQNRGIFWNLYDHRSEPQIFSDTELPHVKNARRSKLKPQRRSSNPNLGSQEGPPTLQRFPQIPDGHSSPLEGLLERAKARRRDGTSLSPSFSSTPSPSPSERDTEWEEVEVTRPRALTVSQGWREQLVDGDEDEDERSSLIFSSGVNVDWSGWCFDDDEVMDQLQPPGQGLLEGIAESLTFWDLHDVSEQEEGEYSQV